MDANNIVRINSNNYFEFYSKQTCMDILENVPVFTFKPLLYADYDSHTDKFDCVKLKDNEYTVVNPLYKYIENDKNIFDINFNDILIDLSSDHVQLDFTNTSGCYQLHCDKINLYEQISYEGFFIDDELISVKPFHKAINPRGSKNISDNIFKFENTFLRLFFDLNEKPK